MPALPSLPADLDALLKRVSRSFYLSLAILPAALRAQLKTAYLVARAADTIADTRILPAEKRLQLLSALSIAIADPSRRVSLAEEVRGVLAASTESASERELLGRLADVLDALSVFDDGDRGRSERVLSTLIVGMERDLQRFPNAQPGDPQPTPLSLPDWPSLDEHTYYAAGCVGEYWTLMCAAHVPGLERLARPDFVARGVRLGKALQLVNVLRDVPSDLREGRCYLPQAMLDEQSLSPSDLLDASKRTRAKTIVEQLRQRGLAHVDAAFPYVLAIPATQPRLRLAALWPLWIGLATLAQIRDAVDPLDPRIVIKIARKDVYALMLESLAVISVDAWLVARHDRRRARAA